MSNGKIDRTLGCHQWDSDKCLMINWTIAGMHKGNTMADIILLDECQCSPVQSQRIFCLYAPTAGGGIVYALFTKIAIEAEHIFFDAIDAAHAKVSVILKNTPEILNWSDIFLIRSCLSPSSPASLRAAYLLE